MHRDNSIPCSHEKHILVYWVVFSENGDTPFIDLSSEVTVTQLESDWTRFLKRKMHAAEKL